VAPRWDLTADKVALDAFSMFIGGQTATACVAARRQGCRTCYAGAFGDDAWGAEVRRVLRAESVVVAAVERPGATSRTAIVLVDRSTGLRVVFERQDPRLVLHAGDAPANLARQPRVLLVDARHPAAVTLVGDARRAGTPVIVDVDRPSTTVEALLPLVDVLVVPESFLRARTGLSAPGHALAQLAASFPRSVVIATLGAEGALARAAGREVRAPGYLVDVVDTTGAGDAFRGGLASAWIRLGPDASVEALLARANATAALNCRAVGAQTALPSTAEVEALVTVGSHGQSKL
jgi:sugar/nucleoside kinase (ribokinase family)